MFSHLEDPVIAVLPYKAQEVHTPGVHQVIVGCTCDSTGCLCNTWNHALTIHLQSHTQALSSAQNFRVMGLQTKAGRVTEETAERQVAYIHTSQIKPCIHTVLSTSQWRISENVSLFTAGAQTVLPHGWQKSVTWHQLSLWPASTHLLHTTPWWSHEGSRTAAHTWFPCRQMLELKLSAVKTASQPISVQLSFQAHLQVDKPQKKQKLQKSSSVLPAES